MMESYLTSPVVKSFVAGSFSGTCSTILFQPLDLIKTRIQSPVAIGQAPSGVVTVFINVIRNERLLGMWKGLAPSLSRTVPGIGVYFSSLHWLRSNYGSTDPPPLESVCMGGLARSVSGLTMLPFTVIKTRFESGQFAYRSVVQALVTIHRTEGMRGLFSGLSATLLRDAPFSGLYLMFYTQLKKYTSTLEVIDPQNAAVHFSCGILAGGLASFMTQPADVVKTHMQLYPDKYKQFHKVVFFVYERDGWRGFLRGVVPRTMRRSLMAAMAWTVYEQIMKQSGLK